MSQPSENEPSVDLGAIWAGRALTSLYTAQRELGEAWGESGPDLLIEAEAIVKAQDALTEAITALVRAGFK